MRLAPSAVDELRRTIEVFEEATDQPVVREALPILLRIYERAKAVLEEAKSFGTSGVRGTDDFSKDADSIRMLDILRGKTRILLGRSKHGTTTDHNPSTLATQIDKSPRQLATATHSASSDYHFPPTIATTGLGSLEIPGSNETMASHSVQESNLNCGSPVGIPWGVGGEGSSGMAKLNVDFSGWPPLSSYDFPLGYNFENIANFNSMSNSVPDDLSTATSSSTPDPDFFLSSQYAENSSLLPGSSAQHEQGQAAQFHARGTSLSSENYTLPRLLQESFESMPLFQNAQQAEEVWHSFVAQSGFTTEEEMMRLWGMSRV